MEHADPNELVITLPDEQMRLLDEAVRSGEYQSTDEVVQEALRLWHRQTTVGAAALVAWHKRAHEDGLASGLADDLSAEERLGRMKAAFNPRG